jgi:excisionase family DNA binding protein
MTNLQDYPLTLKDAAHRLGVTANAVRRLVAAQKLNAERFGPLRELRFREEDVEAFLDSADPAKLHRQLVQRIKQTEPHYQGLLNQPR